jgi:tRNA A-37 threonylcarbamoyl transferase component Bud32/tetratricopeptide (TPR) repeat protein
VNDSHLPPRYRNPERIARGGMGEIFRAEDADLARVVAIKVLADRYANDEAIRARFTREALAAARLSNAPSTVTIFDVGEHNDHPYIVMEYLAGGSLADRLVRDGAQPIGRSFDWLEQAAAALDAAHASGVVHRDVKPANLLLDSDDRVKVADFGVASAVGLGTLTEVGTVVGTAGYLAPEQARGEKATPASDRYALAVVAFELLTGERPFERESSTAEALAHVSAPIPPASSLNPELPSQVDDALARGLAKVPEHRYESAADLVHALRDALAEAAGGTTVAALPPVARSRERRWVVPLVALGALLLAAGVLAAVLLDGDDPKEAVTTAPKTVKETVTLPGQTVVKTVTTEAAPPTTAPETTAPAGNPSDLNNQGFEVMKAGNYEEALPLLEQAVAGLSGDGSLAEAYASYNLAFTRLALGRCDEVAELLDRSEQIQGKRKEISKLRHEAKKGCGEER